MFKLEHLKVQGRDSMGVQPSKLSHPFFLLQRNGPVSEELQEGNKESRERSTVRREGSRPDQLDPIQADPEVGNKVGVYTDMGVFVTAVELYGAQQEHWRASIS